MYNKLFTKYGRNKYYIHTKASSIFSYILSKDELLRALSSNNLEELINTISKKPLGSYIYEKYTIKGSISLKDIILYANEYTRASIASLINIVSDKVKKLITLYERSYDIINIVISHFNIANKGRASFIVDQGLLFLYNVDSSAIKTLDQLYNEVSVHNVFPQAIYIKTKIDPLELAYRLTSLNKIPYRIDSRIKRTIGLANDYIWLRLSLVFGEQVLKYAPELYTFTLEELKRIASTGLKELPNVLNFGYYSIFSNILKDLFPLSSKLDIIHMAHLLHLTNISSDLLYPLDKAPVLRAIIYLHTENTLLKQVAVSVVTSLYIDKLRNIIEKWWM